MKFWDWICAGLCAAWLLTLVWIGHPENDLLKALWTETAGAWVQALGSAIAIYASAKVAIDVQKRANADALARDEAATFSRYAGGLGALEYLDDILSRIEREVERTGDSAMFDGREAGRWLQGAIEVIEYQQRQDAHVPNLVIGLSEAKVELPPLLEMLSHYSGSAGEFWSVQGQVQEAIAALNGALLVINAEGHFSAP